MSRISTFTLTFGFFLSCIFLTSAAGAEPVEAVGSFVEANFPFIQTTVDLSPSSLPKASPHNVVVRGVLLSLPAGFCVLFDQELLRVAAIWRASESGAPLKLASMSQVSYAEPHRKAGSALPAPANPPFQFAALAPGISTLEEALHTDPRPNSPGREYGRGPLPKRTARFEGIEMQGNRAVLCYNAGGNAIREWFDATGDLLLRHIQVSSHAETLYFSVAKEEDSPWQLDSEQRVATSGSLKISISSPDASLQTSRSILVAKIGPSSEARSIVVSYQAGLSSAGLPTGLSPDHARTAKSAMRLWPEVLLTAGSSSSVEGNGLVSDEIPLPISNPWKRRIRPADIAFLTADRAAVVTYDGDVWVITGLNQENLSAVSWERFASGLSEPLSIAAVGGVLQVYTRNGLVRLHDLDGNGEADWYENFSDAWVQSANSRAFPLDMAVASDGSTFISQGGIGLGTPFAGAISRISADGQEAKIISRRAREPYLALNPESGLLTATDQQGNYIPSSVCYLVKQGADFGFRITKTTHVRLNSGCKVLGWGAFQVNCFISLTERGRRC
jgi:hypothetical protein